MNYLDKPINALQREVLHWVAEGCPAGVMQGDTHKSSAVALQSRRLVKISRRGGIWNAGITEGGRNYLETGHYPPRRSPTTVKVLDTIKHQPGEHEQTKAPAAASPAEQLVARVVEGGGSLEMPGRWGKDAIALHNLMDSVNRFGKAPDGQRLVVTDINRNRVALSLEDDPRALRPVVTFKVPERLSNAHPTARVYREDRDRHEVSSAHLSRAVRLVHALATEAERRGYELAGVPMPRGQYWSQTGSSIADGQFRMSIDGHKTRLRLQEKAGPGGEPIPYYLNKNLACGRPGGRHGLCRRGGS
jgi:hypothetical protein